MHSIYRYINIIYIQNIICIYIYIMCTYMYLYTHTNLFSMCFFSFESEQNLAE